MPSDVLVDAESLRAEVRDKYRAVAVDPASTYHFHTGRALAARLGYDPVLVDALPEVAVESFAGVGNPFALRRLPAGRGERKGLPGLRLRLPGCQAGLVSRR